MFKSIMTVLVIAFKYNDILYATSTEEFQRAHTKKLFIICSPDKKVDDFPLRSLFDNVQSMTYEDSILMMPKNLLKAMASTKFFKADALILSNPVLLITKLIFKLSGASKAVWVEDGLMNYYPLNDINFTQARWKKRMLQWFFFIPDIEKRATSFVSYLLAPEQAKSFWGEKKKIKIPENVVMKLPVDSFSFLNGKKIFVGQPLYKDNLITLEEYRYKVNKIIKEHSIDYYLPHFWSSIDENISCEYFTLEGKGVTLEIISSKYNFEIYSISSTVLYSTKLINQNNKTYRVDINGLGAKHPIIINCVDNVIK